MGLRIRPLWFLVTALFWLAASSLLGLILFLAMVGGVPLPAWVRSMHVHAALVGGVGQMILGGILLALLIIAGRSESYPLLFLTMNVSTLVLLMAIGFGDATVVGVAGIFIGLAFLSLTGDTVSLLQRTRNSLPLNFWFYGMALLCLFGGLGMAIALAFRLVFPSVMGQVRLAHVHLTLSSFVVLTIIGAMHTFFPTVVSAPLASRSLARSTFFLLPAGLAILLVGFLLTKPAIEIAGGGLLLAGALGYAVNIVRTWLKAGQPGTAASDHLVLATLFFVAAIAAGLLVSINSLWIPPLVPFGTLHLAAYTHLAMIGFILQTIIGALSYLLPVNLSLSRVKSNKKRGPYMAALTAIAERRRTIQVWALNLGTMGLALTAALVWQFNLGSLPVQTAAWLSGGLLALGLGVFLWKVVDQLFLQPLE